MKNLNNWIGGVFIIAIIVIIVHAQKKSKGASNLIAASGNLYGSTVQTLEGNGGGTNGLIANLGNSLSNALSNINVNLTGS